VVNSSATIARQPEVPNLMVPLMIRAPDSPPRRTATSYRAEPGFDGARSSGKKIRALRKTGMPA
jgi:hypothetical protein